MEELRNTTYRLRITKKAPHATVATLYQKVTPAAHPHPPLMVSRLLPFKGEGRACAPGRRSRSQATFAKAALAAAAGGCFGEGDLKR